jgi:O-methyltransferase
VSRRPVAHSDRIIPRGLWRTASLGIDRYGYLGAASRYLLMLDECRKFVEAGATAESRKFRKRLLRDFKIIESNVPCAHSPTEFVAVADLILGLDVAGPLVECGCFKGGSTAKLSLLAKHTGRRLFVCDSFAGLPRPALAQELTLTSRRRSVTLLLAPGEYRGTLSEVQENIRRYGCLEVCEFVPGLLSESLKDLAIAPAFVFTDVDFVSSARDCLRHLWPRLAPGGLWCTHEAWVPEYVTGILDAQWWHQNLGESPPIIAGGFTGLSSTTEAIAYMRKLVRRPDSAETQ